jgi:tetratricopeptide (TPR) repeat protein
MHYKILLLVCFFYMCLAWHPAEAQIPVMVDEIEFRSPGEEAFFRKLASGQPVDSMQALWMVGKAKPDSNRLEVMAVLDPIIESLRKPAAKAKSMDEKVALVREAVSTRFKVAKVLTSNVVMMAKQGAGRPLDLTVMYALVLKSLDIPFEIIAEDEHVYVRVPNAQNGLLNHEEPSAGSLYPPVLGGTWDLLISLNEALAKDPVKKSAVLNSVKRKITLGQLAGYCQVLEAQSFYSLELWRRARNFYQKAYLLCPNEKLAFAINSCFRKETQHYTFTDADNFGEILGYFRSMPPWLIEKFETESCTKYTVWFLIGKSGPDGWEAMQPRIKAQKLDTRFLSAMRKGELLYQSNRAKDDYALRYKIYQELVAMEPDNEESRGNLLLCFRRNLSLYEEGGHLMDTIAAFNQRYPIYKETGDDILNLICGHGSELQQGVIKKDAAIIEKNYKPYRAYLEQYPELKNRQKDMLSVPFRLVMGYYLEVPDKATAKLVLQDALRLFPDDPKIRMVKAIHGRDLGVE